MESEIQIVSGASPEKDTEDIDNEFAQAKQSRPTKKGDSDSDEFWEKEDQSVALFKQLKEMDK